MAHKTDINTAGVDELARLQGIGEKLAARIVDYRQTVHPFEEVIELAAVPGISERMVREIADQLTVNGETTPQTDDAEAAAGEPEATAQTAEEEPVVAGQLDEPPEETSLLPVPLPADTTSESRAEPAATRAGARAWGGHVLSALGGALLALLALLLLNGTLEFTGANRVADLQRQVDQQRLEQSRQSNELQALENRLATADAARAGLRDQARSLDSDLQALQDELQRSVTDLQSDTEQLSQRLQGVAQAADNFDAFLDGMRDILISLQGLPSTATPTPTLTVTPTRATPVPSDDDAPTTPSPTSAGATRTPRPTSTPIVRATPGATP